MSFTSISKGAFGFPRKEAVGIALSAVKDFVDGWGEKRLKTISFVMFGEGSRDEDVYVRTLT